jgi:hypothetical protein
MTLVCVSTLRGGSTRLQRTCTVRESPGNQEESRVPWPPLPDLHTQTPGHTLKTQGRLRRWEVSNQDTTDMAVAYNPIKPSP